MCSVCHIFTAKRRDGHRALPLPVYLYKNIAKNIHRFFDIGQIHWPSSVHNRAQARGRLLALYCQLGKAFDHSGSCKHMDCAKICPQRKNFHRIKTARYGTNMPSAFHHMHQIIKPRTVRHGGCIKGCLLYTSPSPRDATLSRMPSSA